MAFILRYLVLFLSCAFFVIALVGTVPIPLFEYNFKGSYGQEGKVTITLWTISAGATDVQNGGFQTRVPKDAEAVRVNYLNCTAARDAFRAIEGGSICSTVFGFFAFLFALVMCCCKLKVKLPLFLFLALAFISAVVALIGDAVAYTRDMCTKDDGPITFTSPKKLGYKLSIAFIMHLVSCIGYLITMVLTPFTQDMWCDKW